MVQSLSVLALLTSLALADDAQPTLQERVDQVFAAYDSTRSPGCALGVIKEGELISARGYGMANLEHGIAIDSQTVFRIGSTSKQFAAMAILLLEQDGTLSTSDDVRRFVPELPEYERPITIEHLVHHTSGLRDYLTLMWLRGLRDEDYYSNEEVIDVLSRQRQLNFLPGDEFLYSNSGYFLLSVIVERASGKTLAQFAEERIFEPLGMSHSHFHDNAARIVPRRAAGYAPLEEGGFRISQTTLPMVGDGGLFTTVEDLLLWDRNYYSGEVGSAESRKKQVTSARLTSGKETGYAYGLGVSDYRGQKLIAHGGAFVGYRAEMIRFPELRFSVITLCNLSATNPSALARRGRRHPSRGRSRPGRAGRGDCRRRTLSSERLRRHGRQARAGAGHGEARRTVRLPGAGRHLSSGAARRAELSTGA